MLEIHQRNDINGYSGYLNEFGLSANESKIIEAFDNNKVIGFAIFMYHDDNVKIFYVDYNDDKYLCDGLIRTILFKASLLGIDKAEFLMSDIKLIEDLGFVQKGHNGLVSIQSIMNGCKSCKNS